MFTYLWWDLKPIKITIFRFPVNNNTIQCLFSDKASVTFSSAHITIVNNVCKILKFFSFVFKNLTCLSLPPCHSLTHWLHHWLFMSMGSHPDWQIWSPIILILFLHMFPGLLFIQILHIIYCCLQNRKVSCLLNKIITGPLEK